MTTVIICSYLLTFGIYYRRRSITAIDFKMTVGCSKIAVEQIGVSFGITLHLNLGFLGFRTYNDVSTFHCLVSEFTSS